jgi:2-dehydropantoate 2-reductase
VLLAKAAAREAAAAARASGARVAHDPWPEIARVLLETPSNRTSMLQDVEAGRQTEVDAITGEVVRAAARHGIPAPVNAALLSLVHALSA